MTFPTRADQPVTQQPDNLNKVLRFLLQLSQHTLCFRIRILGCSVEGGCSQLSMRGVLSKLGLPRGDFGLRIDLKDDVAMISDYFACIDAVASRFHRSLCSNERCGSLLRGLEPRTDVEVLADLAGEALAILGHCGD